MPDLDEYIYLLPELERPVVSTWNPSGPSKRYYSRRKARATQPSNPRPVLRRRSDCRLFTYLDASRYLHLGLTRKDTPVDPSRTRFVGYDGWALEEGR